MKKAEHENTAKCKCAECRRAQDQVQMLQELVGASVVEPDANLVARARVRLEEALDALPPKRWYERLTERVGNGFAGLRTVPMTAGPEVALLEPCPVPGWLKPPGRVSPGCLASGGTAVFRKRRRPESGRRHRR